MNTQKVCKSKVLLILLIGIMALSIIPIVVFAEDNYEASVGSTRFSTLSEAFDYAKSQSGNVKVELLDDVIVGTGLYKYDGIQLSDCNITLDLNGHRLQGKNAAVSVTNNSSVFFLSNGSSLTIIDSVGGGSIEKPYAVPAITVGSGAALTVNSGRIESYGAGICVKGGTLTVTGDVEIHGDGSNAILVESGTAQLSDGTYTTDDPDLHSIWNCAGPAADLLDDGYRYGDGNGNEAAFSTDAEMHGVKIEKNGKTVVEPLPPSGVPYIDADGNLAYCTDYKELTGSYANVRGNNWYVLQNSVITSGELSVFGSANLILCDGATLTLHDTLRGVTFDGDSSLVLNLYLQGGGTGKLIVKNGLVKGSDESKMLIINLISPGMKMVDKDGNPTDGIGKYVEISCCTDHMWEYKNQTDTTHDRVCTLCGTTETEIAHTMKSWQSKDKDDRLHYKVCACGKAYEKANHRFVKSIPNPDGLTCTPVCSTCQYELSSRDHEFIEVTTTDGDKIQVCKNCYAELAAEYNGKQYTSIQAAINALSNMPDSEKYGTTKTGTIKIVASELVTENVVVNDPDIVLTIDLGGKEWRASISGASPYVPLTVEKGWVTLKNGRIYQGRSSSSADSGIVITGGSLKVEGSVSVSGGMWDTDLPRPSIDLQDGRLELAAGVTLRTGLRIPEGRKLGDYLPKGTAFVKGESDYESGSVLIPEPYAFMSGMYETNESTACMAIVVHDHVTDEHGKCTQCEKQVYIAVLTKADGTTEKMPSMKDGWEAAITNEGSTLTLLCDVFLGDDGDYGDIAFAADSGKFTLDLAGFSLNGEAWNTLISLSGTADITIQNGKLTNTVYGTPGTGQLYPNSALAIKLEGGKLTLEQVEATGGSGDYDWKQCYSVMVYGGDFTVIDGCFTGTIVVYKMDTTTNVTVKIASAILHQGLVYVGVADGKYDEAVKAFFADGSMLFGPDGTYIDVTAADYWQIISETYATFTYGMESVVKPHTHTVDNETWTVDVAAALCRDGLRHGICSDCGAPVSEVIPALGFDTIKVGHNCSFGEDLSMMYAILMSDLEGCTDIRLVVTKENDNVARTLAYYVDDISGNLYYCFIYDGVAAKEMGDELTAVLEFTRDGVAYSGTVDVYSLKAYAMERLANSPNSIFKNLLVSLLNYGAAAQTYFGYKTDALVNADLTDEQKALPAQTCNPTATAETGNNAGTAYPAAFTGKNVIFGNRITFLLATSFTKTSELEGVALRIRYTNRDGSEVITSVDGSKFVYRPDVGCYTAYFDKLVASELRATLELTLIKDGKAISETVPYSLDTYVQNRLANSASESFKALLEATLTYADSAREYFSKLS